MSEQTFSPRQVLARLFKVYGRVTKNKSLGYSACFHFKASANNAVRNADLAVWCLKAVSLPFRWERKDYEPRLRAVWRAKGDRRERLVRSVRISFEGGVFAVAELRKLFHGPVGNEKKDKMLRDAALLANRIEAIVDERDAARIYPEEPPKVWVPPKLLRNQSDPVKIEIDLQPESDAYLLQQQLQQGKDQGGSSSDQ